MFILTKISDLVQISPEDLSKPSAEAIEDNINAKYANKVIHKIGLCICLYDLLWASEGLIGHGTGIVNVNVEFRLIVFRPFKSEVILGKISSSDPLGINLRTEFFDDIRVPFTMLPPGSYFDHSEQVWIWTSDDLSLYFDHQETVRFRIESEHWFDQIPLGPNEKDDIVGGGGAGTSAGAGIGSNTGTGAGVLGAERKSPYAIEGSMAEEGLGPVLWWD